MIITRRSLLVSLGLALPAAVPAGAASAASAASRHHRHLSHTRVAHSRHHGKTHHVAASGHSRPKPA